MELTFNIIISGTVNKSVVDKSRAYYNVDMIYDPLEQQRAGEGVPEQEAPFQGSEQLPERPTIDAVDGKKPEGYPGQQPEGPREGTEPERAPDEKVRKINELVQLAEERGVAHALQSASETQDREILEGVVVLLIQEKQIAPVKILRVAQDMIKNNPWALDIIQGVLSASE